MFAHFFSIYILGMFFCRYRSAIFTIIDRYKYALTGITAVALIASYFQFAYTVEVIFIQKVLLCFMITYWLKVNELRIPPFLHRLAIISFGIYFVHYYVILGVRAASLQLLGHELSQNLGEWVIVFVVVFALSYGAVALTRVVLGKHSRWLVGC